MENDAQDPSALARALRWGKNQFSLDPQPDQDLLSAETAGDMVLGAVPGVGQAMALRDMERARRAQDPVAGGLAAASLLPWGRLLRAGKNKLEAVKSYHGSGEKFTKFKDKYPGDEANTEFSLGPGPYFHTNPDAAKWYGEARYPASAKTAKERFDSPTYVYHTNLEWADKAKEAATPLDLKHFAEGDFGNYPSTNVGIKKFDGPDATMNPMKGVEEPFPFVGHELTIRSPEVVARILRRQRFSNEGKYDKFMKAMEDTPKWEPEI